jgi:hypothetical protein
MNQHRILDFIKDLFDEASKRKKDCKTVVFNVLGMPTLVFTNHIGNVTHILQGEW